jgi:hypothetical protein
LKESKGTGGPLHNDSRAIDKITNDELHSHLELLSLRINFKDFVSISLSLAPAIERLIASTGP